MMNISSSNTEQSASSSVQHAALALGEHLTRVDLQLARAGLARSERDEVCRQIAEQFHDLLPVPVQQATHEQIDTVLDQLSGESAYESSEIHSRAQRWRMMWHRLRIGYSCPVALNDHGKRRILWGELISQWIWIGLLITLLLVFTKGTWVDEFYELSNAVSLTTLVVMYFLMLIILASLKPIETLPHAQDWPRVRRKEYRFMFYLYSIVVACLLFALMPTAYWLLATLQHRPVAPIDDHLELVAIIFVGYVLLAFPTWLISRQQRRRRCQFQNWAVRLPNG
ncbi:MAG: hypothetical protein IT445_01915 [Phycisphaeraceae bacterium]|nr:hypothetical protein [Phycisphaeraceae bacterium]